MLINTSKVTALVQILTIHSTPLFFSIMGILGVDYEGSESSPLYIIYMSSIFIFSAATYLYSCIKVGFLKYETHLIVFIGLLIATHFIWTILDPINTQLFSESLILSIVLGLPGFFAAVSVLKLNSLRYFIKLNEVVIILISIGIITYSVIPTLAGQTTNSLAGASYQALSYYSAFCFGVLLTHINLLPSNLRYKWTKSKIYTAAIYIVLLFCLIGTLLGGGRGALILLLTYSLLYGINFINLKNWISSSKHFINNLAKITSSLILLFSFMIFFWNRDFVQSGFRRATQFIGANGNIDLESGSSGRNVVYQVALNYISERPLLGYGPFGALDNTIQAHNIFLDIILQYGYFGLVIYLIIFLFIVIIAKSNWSIHSRWALSLILYPLVMLMFSGYYLKTSIFIFCISFFYIYRSNSRLVLHKQNII